jgi:hypothetical protein
MNPKLPFPHSEERRFLWGRVAFSILVGLRVYSVLKPNMNGLG